MTCHALRHKAAIEIPCVRIDSKLRFDRRDLDRYIDCAKREGGLTMPKGSRGTGKPYLRGSTWWIKYSVPGESKPRYESTNSSNKTDAIRLLNKHRSEIDNRQV